MQPESQPAACAPATGAPPAAATALAPQTLRADKGLALLRLVAAAALGGLVAFVRIGSPLRPALALGLLGAYAAIALGLYVATASVRRRWLNSAWLVGFEFALLLAVLWATGGAASPLHPMLYLSVASAAFRFPVRSAVALTLFGAGGYVAMAASVSLAPVDAVATRTVFILLAAVLGAVTSRQALARTAASVREQEQARALTSRVRLATAVEASADAIVSTDVEGIVETWNRGAEQLFGWQADEAVGRSILSLIPDERRDSTLGAIERLRAGQTVEDYETVMLARGGRTVQVWLRLTAVPGEAGPPAGLVAVVRDITEKKRAQAELAEREQRLAAIIASEPDCIKLLDRDGTCLQMNPAGLRMVEADDPAQVIGKSLSPLVDPEHRTAFERLTEEVFAGGSGVLQLRITGYKGTPRWLELNAVPLRGPGGAVRALLGIARDVTEHKQMQARLMLADRLAALGTLAGGLAHEINNPLTYVIANLEFLKGQIAQAGDVLGADRTARLSEPLESALGGADRVRRIVRDVRIFSRPEEGRPGPVDVRRVLESSVRLVANEIRHRARLTLDLAPVPAARATESRLGQVFVNLMINAAQAIPEGEAEKHEIRVATRTDGAGRVVVEVADTGQGIGLDIRDRIFDPFFTTKPVGSGTGLGLAICHGIVTAFGGEIAVDSTVGKGSVFRVTLPASASGAVPVEPPAPSPAATAGRRGRILVVEDDPNVAGALRLILEPDHDVLVLYHGADALKLLAAGEPVDLVLCDLMMPGMTGMDLCAELEHVAPQVIDRMVFITGGAFTPRAQEFLERMPNARLEKPFDPSYLRTFLQTLLASGA